MKLKDLLESGNIKQKRSEKIEHIMRVADKNGTYSSDLDELGVDYTDDDIDDGLLAGILETALNELSDKKLDAFYANYL